MNMGQRIKELRTAKGMTLEELGTLVGVGKSTVRKWETGAIANMKRDKIANLAKALGCTVAYLLGLESEHTKTAYYSFEDTDGHIISIRDETLDVFSKTKKNNAQYYLSEESAKVAQEMFEKDKILLDVYRSADKDRLIEYAKRLKALREMEEGEI